MSIPEEDEKPLLNDPISLDSIMDTQPALEEAVENEQLGEDESLSDITLQAYTLYSADAPAPLDPVNEQYVIIPSDPAEQEYLIDNPKQDAKTMACDDMDIRLNLPDDRDGYSTIFRNHVLEGKTGRETKIHRLELPGGDESRTIFQKFLFYLRDYRDSIVEALQYNLDPFLRNGRGKQYAH